ncbi:uncharacterized protein LOC141595341 [Silene latifolia]|uniref:uncharacterized protein LOC141595341 n=1 Tax=Silene latifolia TaxID=37657 RepID=UPI003D7781F1
MGSIGFWNVRGINSTNKQNDVRYFLHNNNVGIFSLLETRVHSNSINKVHQGIENNWSLVHNNSVHDGGRIWVIWDSGNYTIDTISIEAQVIYVKVTCITGQMWWMSVIYGFNRVNERLPLWTSLRSMRQVVNGPWLIMGDFNNVLAMCERVGSVVSSNELRGFQDCVDDSGLIDLPAQDAFFTWNNKHEPGDMVLSRIDRTMSNDDWLLHFSDTTTMFHPQVEFDHCPCTITLSVGVVRRKESFKYFKMWGKDPQFLPLVQEIWDKSMYGIKMFQLVKTL